MNYPNSSHTQESTTLSGAPQQNSLIKPSNLLLLKYQYSILCPTYACPVEIPGNSLSIKSSYETIFIQ